MAQQLTPLQMAKELYRLQNGGKDKPGRKPVFSANQFYPWKVEREMERYVAEWLAVNGERLKELALIGYAADGLDDLNSGEVFVPEDASAKAGEFFSRVQGFASESLDSFAERTVGRKIGFYSNDSEMRNAFVDNFVAQCKSASEDQKKEIAAAVYRHRMFPDAEGPSLVKKINTINEKYTRKKARFIARNETGNLNAAQQRRQMQGAGFSMYEWMSMPDGVTRDTHRNMNGLVCRWDDDTVYSDDGGRTWKKRTGDMYIGVPGQDFNCRCTAVPFESEFEDEYEVKSLPEDDDEPAPEPIRETKAELMAKLEEQTKRAEKAEKLIKEKTSELEDLESKFEIKDNKLTKVLKKLSITEKMFNKLKTSLRISKDYGDEIFEEFKKSGVMVSKERIENSKKGNERKKLEQELKTAKILQKESHSVYLVSEHKNMGKGIKHPDAVLDGLVSEFKEVSGGKNKFWHHYKDAFSKSEKIVFRSVHNYQNVHFVLSALRGDFINHLRKSNEMMIPKDPIVILITSDGKIHKINIEKFWKSLVIK